MVVEEARAVLRSRITVYQYNTGDGKHSVGRGVMLSMDGMSSLELHTFHMWVMHRTREVLRFHSPFVEILEEGGVLPRIIASDGWMPVSMVVELVQRQHKKENCQWPTPTEGILLTLLKAHDLMQRFEVDKCQKESSTYFGVLCARSVYAHERRTSPPIYQRILESRRIKEPPPLSKAAWVLADIHAIKKFGARGFRLYDNNAFVTAVDEAWIPRFIEYVKQPFDFQHDEKIGPEPLYFLELMLGRVCRDPYIVVSQSPSRDSLPGHYALLPVGSAYVRGSSTKSHHAFFPMAYFTGRVRGIEGRAGVAHHRPPTSDGSGGTLGDDEQSGVSKLEHLPMPKDPIITAVPPGATSPRQTMRRSRHLRKALARLT